MNAVVLLSGGLDSTVAATLFKERGHLSLALTVDYGQRAAKREIESSAAIARALGVPHEVVSLPFFSRLGGSSLLDASSELPNLRPDELDAKEPTTRSAKAVWVPNRNGVLIHTAAAYAESQEADAVVVGFNREEAATFPDNSEEFVEIVNRSLAFSTLSGVKVVSPTASMTKEEIVLAGYEHGAPMTHLWPCYEGLDELCQECESCKRLIRALERAGRRDQFFREHVSSR